MANILCIYENKIATVIVVENFFKELQKYDSRISFKFLSVSNISNVDLEESDILFMIRPNNSFFGNIAKIAKENGRSVIFYLDDDLLNLPKESPDMPWRKKGLEYSAKESDILISSSPYICMNYKKNYGFAKSFQLNTAVSKNDIKEHKEHLNERIKIVYAASLAHQKYFNEFIKPIIKRLDVLCGDKISLTFMGVHPELNVDSFNMPINFIKPLLLNDYRLRIEKENFDIGLAPLKTTEFTKCKYFNKFIEYAMFGIVGIYSNTEPYTFILNNKENGLLVGDNPDDWLQAVCELVNDNTLLKKCRLGAYKTIKEQLDPAKIMNDFICNFPEFTNIFERKKFTGKKLKYYKFIYKISRLGDLLYKAGFFFKQGGLKEVCEGIKRRMLSKKIEKKGK